MDIQDVQDISKIMNILYIHVNLLSHYPNVQSYLNIAPNG